MSKQILTCWVFASSSNPNKSYQALLYDDGSTSCDCPGWVRRCQNGFRTCKHVRAIDCGVADAQSQSRHDYTTGPTKQPQRMQPASRKSAPSFDVDSLRPSRRFELETEEV